MTPETRNRLRAALAPMVKEMTLAFAGSIMMAGAMAFAIWLYENGLIDPKGSALAYLGGVGYLIAAAGAWIERMWNG